MTGHVGVYCGAGRFIECAGGGRGVIEGRISGGKIVQGSRFTHWFKDSNIVYMTEGKEDAEMMSVMKVSYNGRQTEIPSVLRGELNYPNLRALMEVLGYEVVWNETSKVVTLKKK